MGKIRGTHSSPGVYTQFNDLFYTAKTLGITTLGLVGETKKGPAFEPIPISKWSEYTDYFGGTSAEKFKDSLYPKYELPYIAKSYLQASDQLYVCRVLGLSGYNAGPAWVITAEGASTGKYVIAVLRARGSYSKYSTVGDICDGGYRVYDTITFDCDTVSIEPYTNIQVASLCDTQTTTTTDTDININSNNLGQFTIVVSKNGNEIGRYPVSLNEGTKDYIYNVLGSNPTEGSSPLFVEELYDIHLKELVDNGDVTKITKGSVQKINEVQMKAVTDPVSDFVEIPYYNLTRKNLGQTFLCNQAGTSVSGSTAVTEGFKYYDVSDTDGKITQDKQLQCMAVGHIYGVKSFINANGAKEYCYVNLTTKNSSGQTVDIQVGNKIIGKNHNPDTVDAVKVLAYDSYFHLDNGSVVSESDMNDYHEQFRCASTPWIVSELKGDGKNLQVKKLFRFHTISDGTNANSQIKISITNIKPDEGTFDVQIRDFNDSDYSPTVLESYKGLTMKPGDTKYIGLKIGTLNGEYENKSKYVLVEVIENDMTENCVPCGFLGYPVRKYPNNFKAPTFTYNTNYDEDIKERKQYFGLSDITGVDVDMLYYKGKNAYTEDYRYGYTNPFHLDSTLNPEVLNELTNNVVTIDGDITTSGLTWDAVSPNYSADFDGAPIISTEEEMQGTLYEKVSMRKFTVYPYGGFDGWDIYRRSRTNTDEFKSNKYKGNISNGYVSTFSKIDNVDSLSLPTGSITTDYYAYLAGANQFLNPERFVINLFATPGIDYVNNTSLTNDIFDIVESRGDSLYVVTTPDKPFGVSDISKDEIYTSSDVVDNLDDTSIDTYYGATYYPWVKYYDKDNSIYTWLPPTKDALRNMANVDNKKYPWYTPAGLERGDVDCVKLRYFTKIEDEDNVYNGRINPLKTFSEDGIKIWGNKTMYTGNTPMNRINVVRLMLYMKKLIQKASLKLIFDINDTTLADEFQSILNPILTQIKNDRGITTFRLNVSQTIEQLDAHELSATLWVKPSPVLEYIEINFVVTPQGVTFDE